MVYEDDDYKEGDMAHWLVFYQTKSGRLYNVTVDATSRAEAMEMCKSMSRGFRNFYCGASGEPIIKRKVYAHELWR